MVTIGCFNGWCCWVPSVNGSSGWHLWVVMVDGSGEKNSIFFAPNQLKTPITTCLFIFFSSIKGGGWVRSLIENSIISFVFEPFP